MEISRYKGCVMKNIKKFLCLLITLIFSLSLVSCNPELPEDVQAKFDKFLEEDFIEYVSTDTLTLHYTLKDSSKYNIKDFEPTLGTFSADELEKAINDCEICDMIQKRQKKKVCGNGKCYY